MDKLKIGYSPCPNDTFIFHAITHGLLPNCPPSSTILKDIEGLNLLAFKRKLDLTKISFHALGHVRDDYVLLRSGGALGNGCGPLIVAKDPIRPVDLKGRTIALPGRYTTAALLLRLFDPSLDKLVYLPFDKIVLACQNGEVDAGVIIHESRFTYKNFNLNRIIDLGDWWENKTGKPIPLGGILAKRNLGQEIHFFLETLISSSISYSYKSQDEVMKYIKCHSQELDDRVIRQHIDLYVNQYSFRYGPKGEAAINTLFSEAEELGVLPKSDKPLFP
tara:strand:+ start:65687 stop:66514 length:828 start_codon:yes stop_codon:yes gene_type:complete